MKAVVVVCLEPEHLDLCLDALLRWLPHEDILVINNANTLERVGAIERTARRWSVSTGRGHDLVNGENTLVHIHEALKDVAAMWPGETVLKLDEDILLVSRPEDWDVGPMELLVPAVTINNHTSRFFLRELDPELADIADRHAWLWHLPDPRTGEETRGRALRAVYGAEPEALVEHCRRHGDRRRYGREDWDGEAFMTDPANGDRRGISSTVMAFRSDDYVAMCGRAAGIEEVLLAGAVYEGRATYVVDTGIFCHHVNYHSVRDAVLELGEHAERWNRRAVVAATAATRAAAPNPVLSA
ncbi:hypothetical protein FSW04_04240 [Baekduia soli]|uniref:Glycosyltransferase family 2 protein n=1 Tax=Baekduia soli TaxID=496014 RepID=A0A5B8U1N1_9ACTN|nr:hypothetical protein [Baekduia soli]QEC46877.1 hypothetical protein FSW04_04240 [Baekduia soli]